jgi:hypothetical protein
MNKEARRVLLVKQSEVKSLMQEKSKHHLHRISPRVILTAGSSSLEIGQILLERFFWEYSRKTAFGRLSILSILLVSFVMTRLHRISTSSTKFPAGLHIMLTLSITDTTSSNAVRAIQDFTLYSICRMYSRVFIYIFVNIFVNTWSIHC